MLEGLQSMMLELSILALLTMVVISLALYRSYIARQQDFHLHVRLDEAQTVNTQSSVVTRLSSIDKWGKMFTVITVLYFVVLLAVTMYREWTHGPSLD